MRAVPHIYADSRAIQSFAKHPVGCLYPMYLGFRLSANTLSLVLKYELQIVRGDGSHVLSNGCVGEDRLYMYIPTAVAED